MSEAEAPARSLFFHGTVADDHNLVEKFSIVLKGDCDVGAPVEGDLLGFHTHVRNYESGFVGLHFKREVTVDAGGGTVGDVALLLHCRADKRFARLILHDTFD